MTDKTILILSLAVMALTLFGLLALAVFILKRWTKRNVVATQVGMAQIAHQQEKLLVKSIP